MVASQLVDIGGASLECEFIIVPGVHTRTAALVFHPWAWLGGCMWDPVVSELTSVAAQSGAFSTVVRYNVRGVGRSSGFKCFSAAADAEDAAALCRYILSHMRGSGEGGPAIVSPGGSDPGPTRAAGGNQQQCGAGEPSRGEQEAGEKLVLLAYSYGSCVAAHVMKHVPEVCAYVSVGFPLGMLSRMFLGSHSSWQALADANARRCGPGVGGGPAPVPCLLLMGTSDQFTGVSTIQDLVQQQQQQQQQGAAGASNSNSVAEFELKVLDGCDHFFYDRWGQVAAMAVNWVLKLKALGGNQ